MRKADARRIAWFLGLQRILRVPRYSVAPVAVLRAVRRLAAHGPDTPPSGKASSQTNTASLVRSSYPTPQLLWTYRQAPSTIARTGATTDLHQVADAASASPVDRPSPQTLREQAPMTVRRRNVEGYTSSVSVPRHQMPGVQDEYRRNLSPGGGTFGSLSPPALAPSAVDPARQISAETEAASITELTVADTDASLRGQNFHPASDRAPSRHYIAGQLNPWSVDRDADHGTVQTQNKRSAVSTIHLDGSALGRWTVQHLERALGKPATGMTGVDPRATPPRSRVEPF
jgi:hypothetical protein